jgi:hypothetical protein|tara:strand:+ start:4905 stop:5084 length:180 start_codon:yes stop_codon:yes gene_type:complete
VTTPQSASETFDDARDDDDDDARDDARANARDAHPSVAPRARVPVEREDDETARDGWRR